MDVDIFEPESYPIVHSSSLSSIARNPTLRCDSKQEQLRYVALRQYLDNVDTFSLNEILPEPIQKGTQPVYLEGEESDSVPVLSTFCVQRLFLQRENARNISRAQFEALDGAKLPRRGDVLLTVDGGPSIGKPAVFAEDYECAVDSHVAILRPIDVSAELVALLLASPIGQMQFRRAESGASGQTTVNEDDLRRFRFPVMTLDAQIEMVSKYREAAEKANALREEADQLEERAWANVTLSIMQEVT